PVLYAALLVLMAAVIWAGVPNQITAAISTNSAAYSTGMNRQPPGMAPPRTPAAGIRAMSGGPINLVTDAPTLPAPKTPRASPCRSLGNQAAVQAMPAV